MPMPGSSATSGCEREGPELSPAGAAPAHLSPRRACQRKPQLSRHLDTHYRLTAGRMSLHPELVNGGRSRRDSNSHLPQRREYSMTAAEFRKSLALLGLTEEAFAARCDIHRATVYRWLAQERVPGWAAWLVELLLERREVVA